MSSELLALSPLVYHFKSSTSAHSFPLVTSSNFGLRFVFPTELNHAVPRQTTLSIFLDQGVIDSTVEIRERAESRVPMKGRGHAQKEKWGIIQKVCGIWGSFGREKERAFECGVSRMERVRIVSGMGSGEVTMARWSWWRTALRSYLFVSILKKSRLRMGSYT